MKQRLQIENPALAKLFRDSRMQMPRRMSKTAIGKSIRTTMHPFYEKKKIWNASYKKNWGALDNIFREGHVSSVRELLLIQDMVESTNAYIKSAWAATMRLIEFDPQKNSQVAERIMKLRGDIEAAELFRNYCEEHSNFIKKRSRKAIER